MKKIIVFFITLALVGSIFFGNVAKAQDPGFNVQTADQVLLQKYVSLLMQLIQLLQQRLAELTAQQNATQALTQALAEKIASSTAPVSSSSVISTQEPVISTQNSPVSSPVQSSGSGSVTTPEVVAPAQNTPIMDEYEQYKPVITFTASAMSGKVGDKITLSWSVTAQGATRYECSASGAWYGDKAASGSEEIELTQAGTMSFVLSCKALPGNYANSATLGVSVQ